MQMSRKNNIILRIDKHIEHVGTVEHKYIISVRDLHRRHRFSYLLGAFIYAPDFRIINAAQIYRAFAAGERHRLVIEPTDIMLALPFIYV